MLVENQKVKININYKNKEWYNQRGYYSEKSTDAVEVDISDLHSGCNKKVMVLCDICKKPMTRIYSAYIKNKSDKRIDCCDECRDNKKPIPLNLLNEIRTNNYYNEIIDICNKNNYKLITKKEEIKGINTKIKYICPIHGLTENNLKGFLKGSRCVRCSRENISKMTRESRVLKLYNTAVSFCEKNGYKLLSTIDDIVNNKSRILYECSKHGINESNINNLNKIGRLCPGCAKDKSAELYRLSMEEVSARVEKLGGVLLNPEDYKNNNYKNLKILCPCCKTNVIETSLGSFTNYNGQLCEKCGKPSESIGETKIRVFLEKMNVKFHQYYRFEDCRDINSLPFDFYLYDYNLIIEFDGRQHFEDTGFFSYSLADTVRHDKIKNDYCNNHNINILRIPYTKMNHIEELILEKFKELNIKIA